MAIIDLNLATFGQVVKLVKTGKDLLMSGQIDINNLDGEGSDINAVIVKHKASDSSEKEGRVETFPTEIRVKSTTNIEENDLIITSTEIFVIGVPSLRNNSITGTAGDLCGYKTAPMELYETL